jgi:hypothetical protein
MRWGALLVGSMLFGGCVSWADVHRTCEVDAARVLAASSQLTPEMQQENYKNAYARCVTAYGFAEHLQTASQR